MEDLLDPNGILRSLELELGLATPTESIQGLLAMAEKIGIDVEGVQSALAELLKERILLWLTGNGRTDLNFAERRRAVAQRLRSLSPLLSSVSDNDPLVRQLSRFQAATTSAQGKPTRDTLTRSDEVSMADVLKEQQWRCAVCGIPIMQRAVSSTSRFAGGVEPLVAPNLEHKLPYYLVGNRTSYEILCRYCNAAKHDYLGLQEDGVVIAGNFLRRRDSVGVGTRTGFWALWLQRKCGRPNCNKKPSDGVMFIDYMRDTDPFTLDNVAIACDAHSRQSAWWLHQKRFDADGIDSTEELS